MKYTLGVDFGTQSGRSVLVEVGTGNIVAQAVKEYTHGVMDERLPCGKVCRRTGRYSIRRTIWMS